MKFFVGDRDAQFTSADIQQAHCGVGGIDVLNGGAGENDVVFVLETYKAAPAPRRPSKSKSRTE